MKKLTIFQKIKLIESLGQVDQLLIKTSNDLYDAINVTRSQEAKESLSFRLKELSKLKAELERQLKLSIT